MEEFTITMHSYTCWKCKNKFQPYQMVRYFYTFISSVDYCKECFNKFTPQGLAWSVRKYKDHLKKLVEEERKQNEK